MSYGYGWSAEYGFGSRDMETGSLLDVFLLLFSLLFFGSRPGTNGVGMGFYHRHWRWSFPVRRIRRKVAIQQYRSVVGLMGSYDCVRRMIVHSLFPFPSLLFLLDFGPVQMASARVFTTCHWRWSFPVGRIRRKVALSGTDR